MELLVSPITVSSAAFVVLLGIYVYKRTRGRGGELAAESSQTERPLERLTGKSLNVPTFSSASVIGYDRGMWIVSLTDAVGHTTVVEWSERFVRSFQQKVSEPSI
jgi:hypothetical protein